VKWKFPAHLPGFFSGLVFFVAVLDDCLPNYDDPVICTYRYQRTHYKFCD